MMEKSQNTSPAKRSESLLSQYRRRMIRESALLQDGKQKEEVEQLIELTDDLNALFEHG